MNTHMKPTSVMIDHLRTVTRPAHDALEGTLGLLDEKLGIDTYKHILGRFYGFWSGWQPQVSALFGDEQFLGPRRRLHLLAADLAALGVSTPALKALPICPLVPLGDDVEALGSLYVMEGSTLGGRIIRRNVERCLGDEGRASCSYFNGYGSETGAMWLLFLARLGERPACDAERAGRGAIATFERLGWWLGLPARPAC
jgi:heme oxygenase (biliverdin-IX-beta and delta-forming)